MVGSGHPKGFIALHTLKADYSVLHHIIQRMAHMKLAGYIGRGYNYGKRLFIRIDLGMKISLFLPFFIQPVFHLFRIILLIQHVFHFS